MGLSAGDRSNAYLAIVKVEFTPTSFKKHPGAALWLVSITAGRLGQHDSEVQVRVA